MSLTQYSKEQLKEMSLIDIAFELLESKKQAVSFKEILDEIKDLTNISDEELRAKLSQFYTDLNIDGRFLALGENRWGLRVWYPIDQIEEEIVSSTKPKKKKKKKASEEDEVDVAEFDDMDEDLEYDDIEDFEDDADDEEEDELLVDDIEDDEFEEDEDLIEEEEFEIDEELEDDDLELDEEDEEK